MMVDTSDVEVLRTKKHATDASWVVLQMSYRAC